MSLSYAALEQLARELRNELDREARSSGSRTSFAVIEKFDREYSEMSIQQDLSGVK